LEHRQSLI